MSQENEGAPFIDEARRKAGLRGVVAGYYEGLPAGVTAVDTNRTWCAKLPLLARLYPETWVVACVRGVGAIMDSFDRGTSVYGRIEASGAGDGAVGFALDVLRGLHLAGGAVTADGEGAIGPRHSGHARMFCDGPRPKCEETARVSIFGAPFPRSPHRHFVRTTSRYARAQRDPAGVGFWPNLREA